MRNRWSAVQRYGSPAGSNLTVDADDDSSKTSTLFLRTQDFLTAPKLTSAISSCNASNVSLASDKLTPAHQAKPTGPDGPWHLRKRRANSTRAASTSSAGGPTVHQLI